MSRYTRKPFLRLLDAYVLRAIGELSEEDEAQLAAMTPKLREIYKFDGEWHQIVSAVMEFPETLDNQIELTWQKNGTLAENAGQTLLAKQFAEMFVDANFPT